MTECGLVGVHARRKWRRGKANTAPASDLLQGDFTAEASDHKWVPDITEFACWDGKLDFLDSPRGRARAWGYLLYPPALVLVREKGRLSRLRAYWRYVIVGTQIGVSLVLVVRHRAGPLY